MRRPAPPGSRPPRRPARAPARARAARLLAATALAAIAAFAPTATPAGAAGASLGASGCQLFPADNVWHAPVSRLPVHPRSAAWITSIGRGAGLHADFGSGTWDGGPIGIPYAVVPASQPRVPVRFAYAGESDPGPYPIPADAPVEGGQQATGDRHVLVVQAGTCRLYELALGLAALLVVALVGVGARAARGRRPAGGAAAPGRRLRSGTPRR
jgi:hypothetical protein